MGFGDFVKGALSDGHIASNVVGAAENIGKGAEFAVTHADDLISGAVKAGGFALQHGGEFVEGAVKGTAFLASHPQYWGEAAKQMIKDELKPQNLLIDTAMLGATVATGGLAGGALAARLGLGAEKALEVGKEVEVGVKAARTAEEIGKGAKVAEEAGKVGEEAGRFGQYTSRVKQIGTDIREAQGMEKVNKVLSAGSEFGKANRELITGNEIGMIQRGRSVLATKLLPGVEEGTAGSLQKAAFRTIEGGPGMAREAAQTPWSNAQWRLGKAQQYLTAPQRTVGRLHTFAQATEFAANPEAAAMKYGEQAIGKAGQTSWGQQAMRYGEQAAKDVVQKGFDKKATQPTQRAYEPLVQPGMQGFTSSSFQVSNTANTAVSKRGVSAPGSVTTVGDSGPAMDVGPKNWYGPQGGYNAGRGFTPTGAVPGTALGTYSATGATL